MKKVDTNVIGEDLWDLFLTALEDNEITYTVDQLDIIHKHIKALEEDLVEQTTVV